MTNEKDNQQGRITRDEQKNTDNGFFTDDNNSLQTKEEHEEDAGTHPGKDEKVIPLEPDTTPTLSDKITVDSNNEDLVTLVKDDNEDSFENDDDEAH